MHKKKTFSMQTVAAGILIFVAPSTFAVTYKWTPDCICSNGTGAYYAVWEGSLSYHGSEFEKKYGKACKASRDKYGSVFFEFRGVCVDQALCESYLGERKGPWEAVSGPVSGVASGCGAGSGSNGYIRLNTAAP